MKRFLLLLLFVSACADDADDDAAAPDAGPCTCSFALCRSDGTCWCPSDAGTIEACESAPAMTDDGRQ
jgi:hypothetical protein